MERAKEVDIIGTAFVDKAINKGDRVININPNHEMFGQYGIVLSQTEEDKHKFDVQYLDIDKSSKPIVITDEANLGHAKVVRRTNCIVCLCGSMKFYDDMIYVAEKFTQDGYIILVPFKCPDNTKPMDDDACMVTHFQRIHLADEIWVVSRDGYIGDNTKADINYARSLGKIIRKIDFQPVFVK